LGGARVGKSKRGGDIILRFGDLHITVEGGPANLRVCLPGSGERVYHDETHPGEFTFLVGDKLRELRVAAEG
jgi:hypothetical protein